MTRGTEPSARPPPPPLPRLLGTPLSWVYSAAIHRINRKFDRGRGVVRFDRPVISIGNLSVGGTGKTPMVKWIARALVEAGHRPCIAMRGYGAGKGQSDEAEEYERDLPGVPVIAQADRTLGLIQLFSREHETDGPHSDVVILDDGFQHRRIARDLDIVLIDATRDPFGDRLLPAGWLREPVGSLTRAGAVVITHAESASGADITSLDRRIADCRGGEGAVAVCRHAWTGLDVKRGEAQESAQLSWLSGQRAFVVCAIGNPGPFVAAVQKASGGPLVGSLILRDHDPFSPSTVRRLLEAAKAAGGQLIVTTEKDWSKLRNVPADAWPCPVARPRLDMSFDRGGDQLEALAAEVAARVEPNEDESDQGKVTRNV